jgi:hypothetical protein
MTDSAKPMTGLADRMRKGAKKLADNGWQPLAAQVERWAAEVEAARAALEVKTGQHYELSIEMRMGESAPEYQLRLEIGVQSFTICQPRADKLDALSLQRTFARALAACIERPELQDHK